MAAAATAAAPDTSLVAAHATPVPEHEGEHARHGSGAQQRHPRTPPGEGGGERRGSSTNR